jgi:hypothetical protein
VPVPPELVTPRGRRLAEPQWAYVLTTPGPDGHRHCASVDEDGDGHTAPAGADGHVHAIEELDVLARAGHRHELSAQRCTRRHRHGWCLP